MYQPRKRKREDVAEAFPSAISSPASSQESEQRTVIQLESASFSYVDSIFSKLNNTAKIGTTE